MITASGGIASLDDLREHLQYAIGVELTTIPAYLCALYSIEEGTNTAAAEVIQSVVLEEMLHMALAANVLNAIGGTPSTDPVGDGPSPVPVYPTKVPFIDRIPEIHLQRFSRAALDDFLAIECPDDTSRRSSNEDQYGSIGAFYEAIELGLKTHCPPSAFDAAATARAGCQLTADQYYGGAGTLIEVTDLSSALQALEEIVREGEGVASTALNQTAREHLVSGSQTPGRLHSSHSVDDLDVLPDGWKMYSHYARFAEIRKGRYFLPDQVIGEPPAGDVLPTDWRAVRPMAPDPRAEAYRGTAAYGPMMACNQAYTALVDTIYLSFNGRADALREAVHLMYDLKYRSIALLATPSPLQDGMTLGPGFEYLR